DVAQDPRTAATAEVLKRISAGSFVNMPLMEQGRVVAMVFVNNATPRAYGDSDLRLMREVAERVRLATERARSEAALRDSEAQFRVFAQATPNQIWASWPRSGSAWPGRRPGTGPRCRAGRPRSGRARWPAAPVPPPRASAAGRCRHRRAGWRC
ncbi:GAF domain-containing protein, partial [Pseudomonas syringae]|uniref:GAF domain-containing protein n=1 Tax=Pseudomonas syringae TaxID=317 RepID=UPI000A86767C